MTKFQGFSPTQLGRIAAALGYEGPPSRFNEFLEADPEANQKYMYIQNEVAKAVNRDIPSFDEGGAVDDQIDINHPLAGMGDASVQRMVNPDLPTGGRMGVEHVDNKSNQYIDNSVGQVTGSPTVAQLIDQGAASTAQQAPQTATNTMTAAQTAQDVQQQTANNTAVQGNVSNAAQMQAAQGTTTLNNAEAAQGTANAVDGTHIVNRNVNAAELVDGATANQADVEAMLSGAGDTSVSGNLAKFESQFANGNVPAWAAGPIRHATAIMQQRGLGASSMAGQAIVQAALESSIPIAVGDANAAMQVAQIRAQFLDKEFDQEYQAKVYNATKVSEVANMKFTAEQQIALENAKITQTMDLANLSNNQAMTMAKAAEMANVNMANLNNRQQAAAQNAQAFLNMDMANLNNEQQTALFNTQANIQSLFTDQAAENAARNFNATSQNQTDQFFANLKTQIAQFNASQKNAMEQFNTGEVNAAFKFDAEMQNQRDQFNAKNSIVIAQSNAQWRRDIATADTAAQNYANQVNAEAILGISNKAYENLWQNYRDNMEWAFIGGQNEKDRIADLTIAELRGNQAFDQVKYQADQENSRSIGNIVGDILEYFL